MRTLLAILVAKLPAGGVDVPSATGTDVRVDAPSPARSDWNRMYVFEDTGRSVGEALDLVVSDEVHVGAKTRCAIAREFPGVFGGWSLKAAEKNVFQRDLPSGRLEDTPRTGVEESHWIVACCAQGMISLRSSSLGAWRLKARVTGMLEFGEAS